MTAHDEDRIKNLLKKALPPAAPEAEPDHDLWPQVIRRLDTEAEPNWAPAHSVPWFDWALAAGLAVFAASFPATIPIFLYYL